MKFYQLTTDIFSMLMPQMRARGFKTFTTDHFNTITKVAALLAAVCVVTSTVSSSTWALPLPSADFNQDGAVGFVDYSIFLDNYQVIGVPHSSGDADGDSYVGVLCDGSLILSQWSAGATGSTATVSAIYNSTTGMGSVTVLPSSGGVSGIYLVNSTSTITTGPAISGSIPPDILPPPIPPFGFPATANSVSFYSGPGDTLGSAAPMSTTFSVPTSTLLSDLQFFYQRTGQAALPISIFDTATNTTFVTSAPFPCICIPEPGTCVLSVFGLVITLLSQKRS